MVVILSDHRQVPVSAMRMAIAGKCAVDLRTPYRDARNSVAWIVEVGIPDWGYRGGRNVQCGL
jgi:hypothetical protein